MLKPIVIAMLAASPALAEMPRLEGNVAIHDPSILVVDGRHVSFATGVEMASDGGTVRTKTSPDGITWAEAGPLPGGMPDWIVGELGFTPRNIWAPSVFAGEDAVYLYYSASSFGHNDSLIGVMRNEAFDPARPTEGWADLGLVVRSRAGDDFNAIDPFRIDTGDGRAWLAFGSFWDGIRMIELDPATGRRLDEESEPIRLASRGGGAVEAPALLARDGHYYLFVSFDSCCRGMASTYRIMVGRADDVAGPYLDRTGMPLLEGGGTELLATTGRYRGPGGQEVFLNDGEPWLAFHYYDRNAGGAPRLQTAPLHWTEDGWPELGPLPEEDGGR